MERLEDWNDITFDEAIKEIKSLRQSLGGAVQNAECREEKKDKEIERLRNIAEEINDYNPGILNDCGEGDVTWWQDYIRCEIAACNDHWRQAIKRGGE